MVRVRTYGNLVNWKWNNEMCAGLEQVWVGNNSNVKRLMAAIKWIGRYLNVTYYYYYFIFIIIIIIITISSIIIIIVNKGSNITS